MKNLGHDTDIKGTKCYPKKIKIMTDVNDDELVVSSSRVVLEVNKRMDFSSVSREVVNETRETCNRKNLQ